MKQRRRKAGLVSVAVLAAAALVWPVAVPAGGATLWQEESGRTIHDGVFNAEQVKSGSEVFENICRECHTPDTFGPEYMVGWSGATVGFLFEELQATMPYDSPGILEDQEYVDVLTYLFSVNGVKPGDSEMPYEVEELRKIVIEGPYEWVGSG